MFLLPSGFGKSEGSMSGTDWLEFFFFFNNSRLQPHLEINYCPAMARLIFIAKHKLEYHNLSPMAGSEFKKWCVTEKVNRH